jgi:rhodanese-related sulfurtransferase
MPSAAPAADAKKTEAKNPTLDTAALAALLKSEKPPLVLDARSGKWDDGRRIPGTKSLNATATDEEIAKVAPDKGAKIVTYCSGLTCPASGQLVEKLRKLGYTNVIEYPAGVAGWTEAGQSVEQPQTGQKKAE